MKKIVSLVQSGTTNLKIYKENLDEGEYVAINEKKKRRNKDTKLKFESFGF